MRETLAPRGRPVIAFFGHIMGPTKGFDELLQALARTDATLVATGSLEPEQSLHGPTSAAQIEQLGLARARALARVPPPRGCRSLFLRVADAVVLPYHGGAKSGYTSLLAAMVNGAAVITIRGPENPPWLRDGETALLLDTVDPGDTGERDRVHGWRMTASRCVSAAGARELEIWLGRDPRSGDSASPPKRIKKLKDQKFGYGLEYRVLVGHIRLPPLTLLPNIF